jgi:hypothetical protein
MADIKYKAGSPAAVMTTELDGLANNARAISGAIDNTVELDFWDVELVVTYGTAPSTGGTVELYLVESVDGTNYGDGDDAVAPPATALVGVFPLRAVTTAQRIMLRGVMVPPLNFKYVVTNKAGQAMAASGNTLKRLPYKVQSG